jgi:hypothetical protein
MKDFVKTRASLLTSLLLVGLATLSSARTASASSDFPAALKLALEAHFPDQTYCVPLCTACHNTTKGGPGDINVFGHNLEFHGPLIPGNSNATAKVATALENYFKATPGPTDLQVDGKWDSDGDGVSDEEELKEYRSPSIAGPGAFCTDLTYGCGARIASAPPPVDKVGMFSAGLVVLGLTLLRRRRR